MDPLTARINFLDMKRLPFFLPMLRPCYFEPDINISEFVIIKYYHV